MPSNVVRSFGRQSAVCRWDGFWNLVEAVYLQTELYLAEATFHTAEQIDVQSSRLEDIISHLGSLADSVSPESLAPWKQHAVSLHSRLACMRITVSQTSNPMLAVQSSLVAGPSGGRPRIYIYLDAVREVFNQGYRLKEVIQECDFSRSTLYRRRREAGQLHWQIFTDDEVDSLVFAVLEEHPLSGYRAVASSFRSQGISIAERRIRESLKRVDPTRLLQASTRRLPNRITYFVPGPNSVWHFDGHHKLIRWGFITHGAIDGFSRRIMWLQVRTNNHSETVLECFKTAIQQFGVPERTRCDKGGENVLVVEEMIRLHPGCERPALTGKSTQNTRIERLWYDHGIKVGYRFRALFLQLESCGVLSHRGHEDWPVDGHCLTRVFQWRIQQALDSFCRSWDYHPVRTANSKTPIRMWNDGWASRESMPRFQNPQAPEGTPGPDDENYASERHLSPDDAEDDQVYLDNSPELEIDRHTLELWALEYGAQKPGDEAGVEAYTKLRRRIIEEMGNVG